MTNDRADRIINELYGIRQALERQASAFEGLMVTSSLLLSALRGQPTPPAPNGGDLDTPGARVQREMAGRS